MPSQAPPERQRRIHPATVVAAGLLVLAAGCAADVDHAGARTLATPPPVGTTPPAAPTSTPAPSALPSPDPDSPLTAAVHWLVAYHSASWTDGSPAAWIDRVQPYVTDTLNNSNETLRTGTGGTDWADYTRDHCTSTVTDAQAVIPPESPGTAIAANVQVTGTVHTTCKAGIPASPTEQTSATLVVVKTAAGWRVNQRLF
jgi:hypothetical protein